MLAQDFPRPIGIEPQPSIIVHDTTARGFMPLARSNRDMSAVRGTADRVTAPYQLLIMGLRDPASGPP